MVDFVLLVAVVVVLLIALPILAYFFGPRSVARSLRSFERASGTPPSYAGAALVVATFVFVAVVAGAGDVTLTSGTIAVLGVFGPVFAAVGLANLPTYRRVRAATEQPTGSAGQGLVAVTGEVEPVSEPFDTPAGDTVYCSFDLQQAKRTHRSTHWQTVAEGERVVPLAVDDSSGDVRVDTETATVRAASYDEASADRHSIYIDEGDAVPEDVADFLAREGVDSPDRVDGDYRFRCRVLRPGDTVTAVGEHERVTREGDAFWGITAAEGPAYLFAGDYDGVTAELRKVARRAGPVGTAATLLGVVGAAWLLV